MQLIEAIGTLRVDAERRQQVDDALNALIRIALAQREALRFYADDRNWFDGVPMHVSKLTGSLLPDEGITAKLALGDVAVVNDATMKVA